MREEDLSYSGGVRQEVYHLWGDNNNRPDPHKKVVVYKGYHGRYEWLVKNSKFCLAPYGWGWGIRISEVGGPALAVLRQSMGRAVAGARGCCGHAAEAPLWAC